MTINDIMLRDMADAERQRRKDEERKDADGMRRARALVRVAEVCIVAVGVALLAFLAWCCVSDAPHRFPARVQISR